MKNKQPLDSLCGVLSHAMGIPAPEKSAQPVKTLCDYVDRAFQGQKG